MNMLLLLYIYFSTLHLSFYKEKCPPGTIQLQENLFVDKNEVSILNYREYLYWLKRIFGEEANINKNYFPEITVLDSLAKSLNTNPPDFLTQPLFANYPVVGVSFQQATNYCQWRSDRVYEMLLVTNKIIQWDSTQDKITFFTIKKYRDQHVQEISREKTIRYPEYRLPTVEEWDLISQHKGVNKKFNNKLEPREETSQKKIFNLYGSVAELTATIGISKGGSYKDDETLITSNWIREYSGPSSWLGFRCICSWKD